MFELCALSVAARLRWGAFLHELTTVVWQSHCTTVLSMRARDEVDIDDGTYTEVDHVQLTSVWPKLRLPERGDDDQKKKIMRQVKSNVTSKCMLQDETNELFRPDRRRACVR